MKRFPALLIIALWLTACANLETNSYRTIGSIVVAVDTSMSAWGDYVRAGKATPAQEQKVRALYTNYQEYMDFAERAVKAYQADPKATGMQKAVALASAAAEDLVIWISEYVPSIKKKAR